jgi:hypothetical protein
MKSAPLLPTTQHHFNFFPRLLGLIATRSARADEAFENDSRDRGPP